VQIYPTGVLFTLESHFSDLASRISDPHFASPTQFDFFISGVTAPAGGGSDTSASAGAVSNVVVKGALSKISVTILLRTPKTHDQISVGAGTGIQVTFS
jgi:hypothetical protein